MMMVDNLPLVCLHGWGFKSSVFALSHGFSQWEKTKTVLSMDWSVDDLQNPQRLLNQLPEKASYLAWSFGGLMAIKLAQMEANRIASLTLVAHNPCLISKSSWPGLSRETIQVFCEQLRHDPWATLRRFAAWQTADRQQEKILYQHLVDSHAKDMDGHQLAEEVEYLSQYDLRSDIQNLVCPYHFVLGQYDTLIPAKPLSHALNQEGHLVHFIPGARHAIWLTHLDEMLHER